jgi:hypothetical protein
VRDFILENLQYNVVGNEIFPLSGVEQALVETNSAPPHPEYFALVSFPQTARWAHHSIHADDLDSFGSHN